MFKVLIVDDCKKDIDGIIDYISWTDLECEVVGIAYNGEEGIEKALSIKPDIIITDISMPKLSGINMAEKIKKHLPQIFFIYISCYEQFEFAKKAIDTEAVAYILKPIDIDELTIALKRIVFKLQQKCVEETRNKDIEEQFEKNKNIIKENYLRNILYYSEENDEMSKMFGLDEEKYYLAVILLEQNDSDSHQIYAKKIFIRLELERIEPNLITIFTDLLNIAVIVPMHYRNEFEAQVYRLQSELKVLFNSTFSCFIKEKPVFVKELAAKFKQLSYIINSNLFEEMDRFTEINDTLLDLFDYRTLVDSTLYTEICTVIAGKSNIDSFLQKYFDDSKMNNTIYVRCICNFIINAINSFLFEQNKSLSDIFGNETVLWNKLSNFSSICNVKQWIKNILQYTRDYLLDDIGLSQADIIAKQIKNYIDNNLEEIDVLEKAVYSNNISIDYARRIFKKYTGVTIYNYITDQRIATAKRLLTTTNIPVSDIAKRVGYSSSAYFSTVFKKITNVNPAKYRSLFLQKDDNNENKEKF